MSQAPHAPSAQARARKEFRERQVALGMAVGLKSKTIAGILGISADAVRPIMARLRRMRH
jgi:FixJ family two-component response regulator